MHWPDILEKFLVLAVIILVIIGMQRIFRNMKPLSQNISSGTIRPERWSAWITVLFSLAVAALGIGLFIQSNFDWHTGLVSLLIIAGGGANAGFMAPSLTNIHAVNWSKVGIEGPSTTFGPTLGVSRTSIPWEEITRAGKTASLYWYVQAKDGRRIYWSFLYKGYGALTEELVRHRPDIQLPGDMH